MVLASGPRQRPPQAWNPITATPPRTQCQHTAPQTRAWAAARILADSSSKAGFLVKGLPCSARRASSRFFWSRVTSRFLSLHNMGTEHGV